MKNEVQRANSVANVGLTHNEIGVNEDAEVALWGHPRSSLQTRGCGLGLPHTAGQTVKSRRQFAQMWRSRLSDSELQLLRCEDPDCWTLSSICLKFIPRKWSEAMFQDVCKIMCLVLRQRQRKKEAEGRGGEKKAVKSSSFRGAVDQVMFHSLAGLLSSH